MSDDEEIQSSDDLVEVSFQEKGRCPRCSGEFVRRWKTPDGKWMWVCLDCRHMLIETKDGGFHSPEPDPFGCSDPDPWPREDQTYEIGDGDYEVFDV